MKLTRIDFDNLWDNSMEWGGEWEAQGDRFNPHTSYGWKRAYWFDTYANLLLARTYLSDNNYEFQYTSDETGGWVLLTDLDYEVVSV
jgi:hypothetical protein